MNRRDWLKNAALLVAAGVAADQLDLLDRLQPRRLFAAWGTVPTLFGDGIADDTRALQAFFDGHPVYDAHRRMPLIGTAVVSGGVFRITSTVYVDRRTGPERWFVNNMVLAADVATFGTPSLLAARDLPRHNNFTLAP